MASVPFLSSLTPKLKVHCDGVSSSIQPSTKSISGPSIFPNPSSQSLKKRASFSLPRCSVDKEEGENLNKIQNLIFGACLSASLVLSSPSFAAGTARLPPLSQDPRRCERAFVGNTIGQANGVADKLLDLRFCDFSNDRVNLKGKTLSAALMADANFNDADLTEVVMSKAYAVGASFKGTDFTNAVLDRVVFDKSDLTGAKFINTVLSGSTFDGANLTDANFEDALIGYVDIQKICRNPTLPDQARSELGCK